MKTIIIRVIVGTFNKAPVTFIVSVSVFFLVLGYFHFVPVFSSQKVCERKSSLKCSGIFLS